MTTCRLLPENEEALEAAVRDAIIDARSAFMIAFAEKVAGGCVSTITPEEENALRDALLDATAARIFDYGEEWIRHVKSRRYCVKEIYLYNPKGCASIKAVLRVELDLGPPDAVGSRYGEFVWEEEAEEPAEYRFRFSNRELNDEADITSYF